MNLFDKVVKQVGVMMKKNSKYTDFDLATGVYNASFIAESIMKGDFTGKLFKYGNLKLERNIARLSLPEVITCKSACKYCYAMKQLFPAVKASRLINLILVMYACKSKEFRKKFLKYVKDELDLHKKRCLKKKQIPIFRWHDSGDIYDLEYFKLITDIAKENPEIKFYTYTKNMDVMKEFKKHKYSNFNIVNSFIEGHVNYFDFINNFDREFETFKTIIEELRQDNKKVFICDYNFDKFKMKNKKNYNTLVRYLKDNKDIIQSNSKHLGCGVCTACCIYEYTIFLKH